MMHVRRDPTTRAAVTFEVTPTGAHFTALIIVYDEDGSTVIEGAAFSAAVRSNRGRPAALAGDNPTRESARRWISWTKNRRNRQRRD